MELYQHQKKLIDENPSMRLVAFGCGAGKTRAVLGLADKRPGSIVVVAPKTQVLDRTWEREKAKMGLLRPLTVLSKEQFKKSKPKACDILVLDESHVFCGVLPATRYRKKVEIPRASQIFEEVLVYVKEVKPKAIYLCSATPFPQPMSLWAAATLLGADWDYFAFRRKFYAYIPVIGRGVWVPNRSKANETELKRLAHAFGSFGRLEDLFDVPDQVHKDVQVGMTGPQRTSLKELPFMYPDPLALIGKRHQVEQGVFEGGTIAENKTAEICELVREFPKLLVFCRYTHQIDALAAVLKKRFRSRDVLVLDGRTKERRELLALAEDGNRETVVVAQSQVSTGYELPSFRATVFASLSYSFVDYEQALGRTQRANRISKNVYVHLLAGPVDEAVLECVRGKRDFNEELFAQKA